MGLQFYQASRWCWSAGPILLEHRSQQLLLQWDPICLCYPTLTWRTELYRKYLLLLLFSHKIVSDSLRPHGLQHTRLLCPPLSARVCSNSCSFSWWCCLTISSSATGLLFPSIFPSIIVFSSEPTLHIRWPKYWSFSFNISPSNEYSGLNSFRIDLFDLLAAQGTLKSLLQHHSSKA